MSDNKCDPCVCPELYYANVTAWRKATLELLCRIKNLVVANASGEIPDYCSLPPAAEGIPLICTGLGVVPISCGNLGDVLTVTDTDPCTAAWAAPGGGSLEAFEWSTSEQTWPFEKGVGGETLYAKQFDTTWSAQSLSINHGITGLQDIHNIYGNTSRSDGYFLPIPASSNTGAGFEIEVYASATQVTVAAGNTIWTVVTGRNLSVRMIYSKT